MQVILFLEDMAFVLWKFVHWQPWRIEPFPLKSQDVEVEIEILEILPFTDVVLFQKKEVF